MILTRTHQPWTCRPGYSFYLFNLYLIFLLQPYQLKYGTAASYITVGGRGLFLTSNKEEGYPFKRIATLRHLIATFLAL